jgi:uncharacterized protein YdeI (YjbR/CyaY-like superfamily)
MHPEVDRFLEKETKWKEELNALREIALHSGLTEELKWKQPCYTYLDNNILILGSFKASCVISFFKGGLLKDTSQILEFAGENSQSAKLIRFTSIKDINRLKPIVLAYIKEAVMLEEMGAKVQKNNSTSIPVPDELENIMSSHIEFKKAFQSLTPGRQRAYLMFFAAAKQSSTRIERIQKYMPRILDGKGINDCICGLSKKMPGCDGSHRQLKK